MYGFDLEKKGIYHGPKLTPDDFIPFDDARLSEYVALTLEEWQEVRRQCSLGATQPNEEDQDMKSFVVHYKNKYPGAKVSHSDDSLDVYSADGSEHYVALRKNGAGQILDVSEEMGCRDRHDLAPIPKAARVHKLHADGRIGLDEQAEERRESQQALADLLLGGKGKVPSEHEIIGGSPKSLEGMSEAAKAEKISAKLADAKKTG